MVAAYRKPRGSTILKEHEAFNDAMKPLRVISEHTIGILKGRFPWLRSIRKVITSDKNTLRRILRYIEGAAILHNLLVEVDDDVPCNWIDYDDFSDIDDPTQAEFDDSSSDDVDQAIPACAEKDERRERVMRFINEPHDNY